MDMRVQKGYAQPVSTEGTAGVKRKGIEHKEENVIGRWWGLKIIEIAGTTRALLRYDACGYGR